MWPQLARAGLHGGPALLIVAAMPPHALTMSSPAFEAGAAIPQRFTCEGADVSPPLRFRAIPRAARSLALVVDDPDAPDPAAPKRTWVHWVLYDLDPSLEGLSEGAATALPTGAREGLNDWKRTGWGGPCPPIGRHRYFFRLYALDRRLGDLGRPTRARLDEAMKGHVVGTAEWMGTYEQRGR